MAFDSFMHGFNERKSEPIKTLMRKFGPIGYTVYLVLKEILMSNEKDCFLYFFDEESEFISMLKAEIKGYSRHYETIEKIIKYLVEINEINTFMYSYGVVQIQNFIFQRDIDSKSDIVNGVFLHSLYQKIVQYKGEKIGNLEIIKTYVSKIGERKKEISKDISERKKGVAGKPEDTAPPLALPEGTRGGGANSQNNQSKQAIEKPKPQPKPEPIVVRMQNEKDGATYDVNFSDTRCIIDRDGSNWFEGYVIIEFISGEAEFYRQYKNIPIKLKSKSDEKPKE
jgi:hypothetical protein